MAEFPALPLWTDAYLGDTRHLTTIEHGAYLLLLIAAWRLPETRLPDDDKKLARYAGLTATQWGRIKPTIAEFFTIADGVWMQSRLTDEAKAVRQRRDAQASAGRASALKRKDRHSTKRQRSVNEASTPTTTPIPTPIEEEETPDTSPPTTPREGDDDVGTWDVIRLANELTRIGGVRNIDPGQIIRNTSSVREWLDAGADPPLIVKVVQTGRDSATNGIGSLKYFDGRVRAAIARRDHPNANDRPRDDFADIRDPLLRRYLERGGTLGGYGDG